ncbi:tetraspanin-33-like [Clytia hemisphaerica]
MLERDTEVSICVKYLLFFFNVFFWLLGGFLLGVGLWARVVYAQENESLGLFGGWHLDPAVLFIIVGVIMFLLGFCGCIGALRENICLLKFFTISLSIIFFTQLAGGIIGFVFRAKVKELVKTKLHDTIVHYRDNANLQNLIDFSQETFKCCGLDSYQDWQQNAYFNCTQIGPEACSVPYSCCKTDMLNTQCGYGVNKASMPASMRFKRIYTDGCVDGITGWFYEHIQVVGGLAVGVAVMQIIVIAFASSMIADVRRQKAKWETPRNQFNEPLYPLNM